MRIVCIGDSLTSGQFLRAGEAWPEILAERVSAQVENAGLPGDTTRSALERFPSDVQARRPDAVIIQFGLNDCNRWATDHGLPRVSLDAFVANLREMLARAEAAGAEHVVVIGLGPTRKSSVHAAEAILYDTRAREIPNYFNCGVEDLDLMDDVHWKPEAHRAFAYRLLRRYSWLPAAIRI